MASLQVGPKSLEHVPEQERFSFGEIYEKKMCSLVHKYLELGTQDRLCYVGQPLGSLAPMLQRRFCLLKPVVSVIPGHIHAEETADRKSVPIKIPYVGADEYFKDESENPAQFDTVLLHNTIQYLQHPKKTFENILKTLNPGGRLLVVHRPPNMNTLPVFKSAVERLKNIVHPYMEVIRDLQSMKLDVQWEIECLPVKMPKTKWISMIQAKFPPEIEAISPSELQSGVRELSEGIFKDGGDDVEFSDRLLFVSAWRTEHADPCVERFRATDSKPVNNGLGKLQLQMELSPDIQSYIAEKSKQNSAQNKPNKGKNNLGLPSWM